MATKPELPKARVRFELITLGNELLLGLTPNGHLSFIGAELARSGVELARNVTITDSAEEIARQFRESWERADVVITTGGLGPTSDDRTREVIAEVLGQKLVLDPAIEAQIADRFARINRKMTPNNLKQAFRPERSEAIENRFGTAPGLWVEQDGKVLIMLPGPPAELQPMLTDQVMPRLAALGLVRNGAGYVQIRTIGVGESSLETEIIPVLERYPDLDVAYCAHQWAVDVRLSARESGAALARADAAAAEIASMLGENFLCFGHETLARIVGDLLRRAEKRVAVGESGTGGLLSHSFTGVKSCGRIFAGGVVCYCNDTKIHLLEIPECLMKQHGAVSAECAVAMATAAAEQMIADYGLSVTGYAGGDCHSSDLPNGSFFIGLHTPNGAWSKRLNYPGIPAAAQARAVMAALDWLRRDLLRATQPSSAGA
ncbi:MAG TPA: CinA family nicotinamide mononucleotide deamidase-related protein [Opitutaceae bacterium]|nr:CinA family nicotinamide mononucleotide deamidase-related protein [Opitutaceae bacterium]